MCRRCHDAYLDGFFVARFAGCEAAVGSVAVVAFTASRRSSENTAIPFILSTFSLRARRSTGRGESPAVQPSPYTNIEGLIFLSSATTSFMVSMSWIAIRSKRKPSIWYSSAQYFYGVDYEVAHLLAFRSCFVAATRCVAVRAVGTMTVVVAGAVSEKLESSLFAVWLYTTSITTPIPASWRAFTICFISKMRALGLAGSVEYEPSGVL